MGGQQIVPDIPGIDRENVFGIEDILLGRCVIAGREVAVIGGGHVGLEVAHFLCANNKVTIVEMADEIGASVYYITKFKLLPLLREAGVTFRTGQAIAAVDDGGIRLRDTHTGQCTELKAEAVVLAMGSRPDRPRARRSTGTLTTSSMPATLCAAAPCSRPTAMRSPSHGNSDT